MTTELEKQFFDTFGVEATKGCTAYEELGEEIADEICEDYCPECFYFKEVYPQITDTILLELFCIANQHENYSETTNIKNIKERTLRILLRVKRFYKNLFSSKAKHNNFVRKVQAIFKGKR